jgi:hypothetical protein
LYYFVAIKEIKMENDTCFKKELWSRQPLSCPYENLNTTKLPKQVLYRYSPSIKSGIRIVSNLILNKYEFVANILDRILY